MRDIVQHLGNLVFDFHDYDCRQFDQFVNYHRPPMLAQKTEVRNIKKSRHQTYFHGCNSAQKVTGTKTTAIEPKTGGGSEKNGKFFQVKMTVKSFDFYTVVFSKATVQINICCREIDSPRKSETMCNKYCR